MSELKPCPFCGEPAEQMIIDGKYSYQIGARCVSKECEVDWHFYPTKIWNTRPIEDALNARIAELEAFINQLIEAGDGLVGDCELNWKHNHIPDCPPANHWQALVDDWKEG